MRPRLLPLALAALLALPASALPPALLWQAPGAAASASERHALLAIELGPGGARVVASRVVEGPAKILSRPPGAGGLYVLVATKDGEPLVLSQTFDARPELFGDEPDPATGELRSLTVVRDTVTFPVRVPLAPGAATVTLLELSPSGAALPLDQLLIAIRAHDPSLRVRGMVTLSLADGPEARP